jgi:hypothetical protein
MGTVAEDGDPETRACCSRHIGRPGSAGPKIDARSWAAGETSSRISGAATGSNFSGPGPVEPLEATEARLVGRRCQGEANRKARLQALTARAQASSQHLLRPTLQNLLSSSSSTTPPPQTTSLGLSRPSVTPLGGRLLTLNHQGQSRLCKPWPSRLPARSSRCRSALQHPTFTLPAQLPGPSPSTPASSLDLESAANHCLQAFQSRSAALVLHCCQEGTLTLIAQNRLRHPGLAFHLQSNLIFTNNTTLLLPQPSLPSLPSITVHLDKLITSKLHSTLYLAQPSSCASIRQYDYNGALNNPSQLRITAA